MPTGDLSTTTCSNTKQGRGRNANVDEIQAATFTANDTVEVLGDRQ
ncbi:hypothetical protein NKJ06_29105 [Mesorhizobium sp. M0293]